MSTFISSNTLIPHSGTAPATAIQGWSQFVDSSLTAGGWVAVPQTGEANLTTITGGGGANTSRGFKCYRMADALQATFPVFLRVDFVSGTNLGNSPALWFTLSRSLNGSGGTVDQIGVITCGASNNQGSAPVANSYISAANNRFTIAIWCSGSFLMLAAVERTRDSAGNLTGDGLLCSYMPNTDSGTFRRSRYFIYAGGAQPAEEQALAYIVSNNNPSQTFGGDIGCGALIHFKGVAQQPGTNIMMVNSLDVGNEGSFTQTIYGSAITYQQLGALIPTYFAAGTANSDTNCRVSMRYD